MTTDDELQLLHAKYCGLINEKFRFPLNRYAWERWQAEGFTESDLFTCVEWALAANRKRSLDYQINFHPSSFLQPSKFECNLYWAEKWRNAKKRIRQPSAGERALAAMRHEEVRAPEIPAKRVDIPFIIEALQRNDQ